MDDQTLGWTTKAAYSARISPEEWEKHKEEVQKMLARGKTRLQVLAFLKKDHAIDASLNQLQRQLRAWRSPTEEGNIFSTFPHQSTDLPKSQSATSTIDQSCTRADNSDRCSKCVSAPADRNQGKANKEESCKRHSMQQKATVPVKSPSTVRFDATLDQFNDVSQTSQTDSMGLTDHSYDTASRQFRSSKSSKCDDPAALDPYSLERQYLKDLLQYIRGLRCDLHEPIQELEGSANSRGKPTCRSPKRSNEPSLEDNEPSSRKQGGDNRVSGTSGTKRPLGTVSFTASELGEPECLSKRVALKVKKRASPTMLSTDESSLGSMISIQQRSRRRLSSYISRDEDFEKLSPSRVMRRRHSMDSTSFAHVTGMPACSPLSPTGFGVELDEMSAVGSSATRTSLELALGTPDFLVGL